MAENIPTRPKRSEPRLQVVEPPAPPAHLTKESGRIWAKINEEWVLGPDSLPLLQAACESWDSYQAHRTTTLAEPTISSKSGMVRANPAARMANDALREFRMCLRQLGLEPPK